jgi:hypothetical protein
MAFAFIFMMLAFGLTWMGKRQVIIPIFYLVLLMGTFLFITDITTKLSIQL